MFRAPKLSSRTRGGEKMGFFAPDSPTKMTEMSESDELEVSVVAGGVVSLVGVSLVFSGVEVSALAGGVVSLVGVVFSGVGGVSSGSGDVSLRRFGVLERGEL